MAPAMTDSGNKAVIGGIAREFYQRVKKHYDNPSSWKHELQESTLAYIAATRDRQFCAILDLDDGAQIIEDPEPIVDLALQIGGSNAVLQLD